MNMNLIKGLDAYHKGALYEKQILSLLRSESKICWSWKTTPLHILVDSGHCRFHNNNRFASLSGLQNNPLSDTGVDLVILEEDTSNGLRKLIFVQIKNYEDLLSLNDLSGILFWLLHSEENIHGLIIYSGKLSRELREWEKMRKIKFRHVPYDSQQSVKYYPTPTIPIRKEQIIPNPFSAFAFSDSP
jgi:hypothetical protein